MPLAAQVTSLLPLEILAGAEAQVAAATIDFVAMAVGFVHDALDARLTVCIRLTALPF